MVLLRQHGKIEGVGEGLGFCAGGCLKQDTQDFEDKQEELFFLSYSLNLRYSILSAGRLLLKLWLLALHMAIPPALCIFAGPDEKTLPQIDLY